MILVIIKNIKDIIFNVLLYLKDNNEMIILFPPSWNTDHESNMYASFKGIIKTLILKKRSFCFFFLYFLRKIKKKKNIKETIFKLNI